MYRNFLTCVDSAGIKNMFCFNGFDLLPLPAARGHRSEQLSLLGRTELVSPPSPPFYSQAKEYPIFETWRYFKVLSF
jgi:hypothetical protein